MMHGRGIFKWLDGRIQDGEYDDDNKQGTGCSLVLMQKYEGQWYDGKQHEIGVQIEPEKEKRKCDGLMEKELGGQNMIHAQCLTYRVLIFYV